MLLWIIIPLSGMIEAGYCSLMDLHDDMGGSIDEAHLHF